MQKQLNNNGGAALIIVMSILSVVVIIIGIVYYGLNAESKMTYNYTSHIRAMQVAETGADLAINEWIKYINEQHDIGALTGGFLNISEFKDRLKSQGARMATTLGGSDYYNTNEVYINYSFSIDPDAEFEENPTNIKVNDTCFSDNVTDNVLYVNVEGEYDGEIYLCQVKLKYCNHGDVRTYKGIK